MSDSNPPNTSPPREADPHAMLFAHLVLELSNTALMFLGKAPHPESGKPMKDLQAARLFIDQLEMLEAKTKGNLSKEETNLLKQTLMTLRLGFVEAVDSAEPATDAQPKPAAGPATAPPETRQTEAPGATPADEESRVKFSKKY
jgi:hypothetical protein